VEGLLPPQEAAQVLHEVEELLAADPERLINVHQQCQKWAWKLATAPAILNVVSTLIGSEIILQSLQIQVKPPRSGIEVRVEPEEVTKARQDAEQRRERWRAEEWHVDIHEQVSVQEHDDPTASPYDPANVCTLWLALDDINAENGAICWLPQLHHQAVSFDEILMRAESSTVESSTVESSTVESSLKSGHALLLHPGTPYALQPNHSERWRRLIICRYVRPCAVPREPDYAVTFHSGELFQQLCYTVQGSPSIQRSGVHPAGPPSFTIADAPQAGFKAMLKRQEIAC